MGDTADGSWNSTQLGGFVRREEARREHEMGVSPVPTAWAVRCLAAHEMAPPCNEGKLIFLTYAEYMRQMNRPDSLWKCPYCGYEACWDDNNYESFESVAEEQ